MVLYRKRERSNSLSIKIGIIFSKFGLSPNSWTLLVLVPSFASLYYIINSEFILAAICMIIAAFLDFVDGSVARVMGKVTKFGAYLDTIMDRYVEALIVLGLLVCGLPEFLYIKSSIWLYLFFFGSMMTTYAKAAAKEKDLTEKELSGGLLERGERMLILFVGLLMGSYSKTYLSGTIALLAVLTNITALQRMAFASKASSKKD